MQDRGRKIGRRPVVAGLLGSVAALGIAGSIPSFTTATSVKTRPVARRAPQWDIAEWLNGDGGNVDALRGKVIVIDFFQLWCPGCIAFSIPLMNQWEKKDFADEVAAGRLAFISIHTVFEGHGFQTPKRLRSFIRRKKIVHPVGIDRHRDGNHVPETMRRYGTRGTPEMAIIDKAGMIRFQEFGHFDPDVGKAWIRRLLNENAVVPS